MAVHLIIFTLLLGCLLTTAYSDGAKCEKLDAKKACEFKSRYCKRKFSLQVSG